MLVRYRVRALEEARTVRGEAALEGSVYHPELVEFTGLVTRARGGGIVDIVIFPPGRAAVHVTGVALGKGAGMAEAEDGGK